MDGQTIAKRPVHGSSRRRRRRVGPFAALTWVALAVGVAFLALPIVAMVSRTSPAELADAFTEGAGRDALWVSIKTNLAAQVVVLVIGTPAAYLLATRSFRGRSATLTLIELPLVLPPAVAGLALVSGLQRAGLEGPTYGRIGVILAVIFVSSPLYVRQAVTAFETVDRGLLDASRTLGAGAAKTFRRVAVPIATGGLTAGAALALARGLSEFGATLVVAGSIRGETQTLPIAIYAELDRNVSAAIAIGVVLLAFSVAVLLAVKLAPVWRSSR